MIIGYLAILVIGFVMLVKGADWFVDGAASLAARFGIPQLVIGLTIVAMGTSLPEAAVSITGAINGNAEISVGNVLGSNILNILIILGLTAVITPVKIQRSTLRYEIPFMLVITGAFLVMGMTGENVVRVEGVVLWLFFIVYLVYLFYLSKQSEEAEGETKAAMQIWKCILFVIVGGVLIVLGSRLAVNGASGIARFFGVSERFIGLTIVALGTSLPELVTSVTAARKGNADIAIGNIVGSNIFNILFVSGTSALICDIPFALSFVLDAVVAIVSGVLLWMGSIRHKELRRLAGGIMLVFYGIYFVVLCL
ncbi:MAG: calcium/sodium antiporter [Lachnospiraceae bacterium]|nr:calcium/sodium antiporter [Lachnospiraceae bacterium]